MASVGERIWNLSRAFNAARGVRRQHDYLPERFSTQSLSEGPIAGRVVTRGLQDAMLDEYYSLRGWSEDGIPLEATLKRLGVGCEESC